MPTLVSDILPIKKQAKQKRMIKMPVLASHIKYPIPLCRKQNIPPQGTRDIRGYVCVGDRVGHIPEYPVLYKVCSCFIVIILIVPKPCSHMQAGKVNVVNKYYSIAETYKKYKYKYRKS